MTPATRCWLAGLIECSAQVIHHVAEGLTLLAEHLDPECEEDQPQPAADPSAMTRTVDGDHIHLIPTSDPREHDLSDDCPCGPRVTGFAATGRGDRWELTHNRMED